MTSRMRVNPKIFYGSRWTIHLRKTRSEKPRQIYLRNVRSREICYSSKLKISCIRIAISHLLTKKNSSQPVATKTEVLRKRSKEWNSIRPNLCMTISLCKLLENIVVNRVICRKLSWTEAWMWCHHLKKQLTNHRKRKRRKRNWLRYAKIWWRLKRLLLSCVPLHLSKWTTTWKVRTNL